jgi:transposase
MIDLNKIKNIYVYPETTDFRNGIYGLRKLIDHEVETQCLYVFANKTFNSIKIIETEENAIWLYLKRLTRGRFQYPESGDKSLLTKGEIGVVLESVSLINRIESKGGPRSLS